MEWAHQAVAATVGAAIGIVVVTALSWSLRFLAEPADSGAEPVQANSPDAEAHEVSHRIPDLPAAAKAAIILLATLGYGLVGYGNRHVVAPAPSPLLPEALAAADAPLGPAQFDVDGVSLVFDPPAGYCVFPPAQMRSVVAQQEKLNPDNAIHVAFGNCDQVRAAATNPARIRDFGILMTPKAQLGKEFDRAQLDQIVASATDLGTLKETLDQRLKEAESQLTMQSFYSLGPFERDDRSIYFAYLTRTHDVRGSYTQACVMAMMALKGRLVSYYLYSDYDKDARAELFGLLQKVKSGVDDLVQRNG
jgi:hypothetical protein